MVKKRYFIAILLISILISNIGLFYLFTQSANQNTFIIFSNPKAFDFNLHSNKWNNTGNPICLAPENQTNLTMVRSGQRAIIVWQDNRSGNWDIYAQSIDDFGNIKNPLMGYLWTSNGIVICNATSHQVNPQLISDGSQGAIIVWEDNRSGNWDIYTQRINKEGRIQWPLNGNIVCNATGYQKSPKLVSNSKKGAIISWYDNRTGSEDIYAQNINSSGNPQWKNNGIVICNYTRNQNNSVLCSDGNGGAIIAWMDDRTGTSVDIYAQLINKSGYTKWDDNGSVVCNATGNQTALQIISDGSKGCIIVWADARNLNPDIFTQKINQTGHIQWGKNGTVICNDTAWQKRPKICEDGSRGAIISWLDDRSGNFDIYGQHINSTGSVSWVLNGSIICNHTADQENHEMIEQRRGAIIVWSDDRSGSYGIYSQFIEISGNIKFKADKIICDVTNDQNYPKLCPDSKDGAIIAWEDTRSSIDIYSQRIARDGRVAPIYIYIPYRQDITPNTPLIIIIALVFGIPLGFIFIYCLLQMRPEVTAKKVTVKKRRRHPRAPT